jgi:hypothetical protein
MIKRAFFAKGASNEPARLRPGPGELRHGPPMRRQLSLSFMSLMTENMIVDLYTRPMGVEVHDLPTWDGRDG